MCGRYYIAPDEEEEDWEEIIAILQRRSETVKTGDIFPSDTVPVIANSRSMRPTPFAMRWGYLLPNGKRVMNARSETAADRALFRDGMCQRRCLIPASNYFEWERKATGKVKYAIRPRQNGLMYMAGIYRIVDGRGEFFHSDPSPRSGDTPYSRPHAGDFLQRKSRRMAGSPYTGAGASAGSGSGSDFPARRSKGKQERRRFASPSKGTKPFHKQEVIMRLRKILPFLCLILLGLFPRLSLADPSQTTIWDFDEDVTSVVPHEDGFIVLAGTQLWFCDPSLEQPEPQLLFENDSLRQMLSDGQGNLYAFADMMYQGAWSYVLAEVSLSTQALTPMLVLDNLPSVGDSAVLQTENGPMLVRVSASYPYNDLFFCDLSSQKKDTWYGKSIQALATDGSEMLFGASLVCPRIFTFWIISISLFILCFSITSEAAFPSAYQNCTMCGLAARHASTSRLHLLFGHLRAHGFQRADSAAVAAVVDEAPRYGKTVMWSGIS